MDILNKIKSLFTNSSQTVNDSQQDQESTLEISSDIKEVLENEILPGLDISAEKFWISFEKIIDNFSPRNKALLERRQEIQTLIDEWHISKRGTAHNHDEYRSFLEEIGYIAPRANDLQSQQQM